MSDNNFYKKRCEHLEKIRECTDVVMGIKEKKIENLEATIKEQDKVVVILNDYNEELKSTVQDLIMEIDALKEKNNIEIGG